MKMKKISGLILAFTSLLMSIGLAFGQTTDERKLELVVQTGHTDTIKSVSFSPNGKYIASASNDRTIKIWEAKTLKEIKTIKAFRMFSFSPNSKYIVANSNYTTIKIWNVETGVELRTLQGENTWNTNIIFSPSGNFIAAVVKDKLIKIWDTNSGTEIRSLDGDPREVSSIAFSPNNQNIVSAGTDGKIKIWDINTGNEIKNLINTHTNWINSIVFSLDGKQIISGSSDKTIKIWDVDTSTEIKTLVNHTGTISVVSTSLDGKQVFSGSWVDNTIRIWDVKSGSEAKVIQEGLSLTSAINFSRDGEYAVISTFDNSIKIFDLKSGEKTGESKGGYNRQIKSVAISEDGKKIVSGNNDGTIRLWNINSGIEVETFKGHSYQVNSVDISPNGKYIVSGSLDGLIKLWNTESGALIKTFIGRYDKETKNGMDVDSVAFSPDGKYFAAGSYETIDVWNTETGELVKTFNDYPMSVYAIAFSPNSKFIVGTSYNSIKIWNIETGLLAKDLNYDNSNVKSVAFSPDGNFIATGNYDEVIVWNIEKGLKTNTFQGEWGEINSVTFSPDGKYISIGNEAGKIELLDLKLGISLNNLMNHFSSVNSVIFSSNAKQILSGGDDAKLKIWDAVTNKELATLIIIDENDWAIISSDGRFDASEGALKLMHYSYGLEIINLEQLKEAYYEPGLLQKLLGYSTEPLRPIVPLSDVKLYPEVVEQTVAPNSTKLTVKLKNRGGGIGAVQVFVGNRFGNKLAVEDARDAKLRANPNVAEATLTVDLQGTGYLKGEENEITVVTSNYLKEIGKGNIQSRGSKLVWTGAGSAEEYKLPTLYAIVGGVSDYAGENLDLRFAAKDAEDFSNALSLGAKRLFCDKATPDCIDKVNITTLSTSGNAGTILPTKENFRTAFREVASKAKPEDIVVIYLAGHGVSFGVGTDSYFYLTQEARTTSREDLAKVLTTSAISSDELSDWLTANTQNADDIFIKAGKQVIILDTCASGNAAEKIALSAKRDLSGDQIRAVEFLKDKTGTFVLMASTADAPSYEASEFGQGLLTYSLLQAMQGAALDKGGYVDVQQLFAYAQKEVPQMATNIGGVQKPIVSAPLGKTFTIGQMTDAETKQINLPSRKPRMLRPLLTSPPINNDPLKLIPELRKRFDAESSYEVVRQRGDKEPQLIYIDDDNFPGAVRVTGTYTVEGENVKVKAYLIKDEKVITELREFTVPKEKAAEELMVTVRVELAKLK